MFVKCVGGRWSACLSELKPGRSEWAHLMEGERVFHSLKPQLKINIVRVLCNVGL